ncbi:MAG TPA: glycosyltransferase family 1 protein, partial [Ferruginibacter sp.]|nr:glycosyltransferase family 1 protein [Ferruginibacter sp.]
LYNLPPRFFLNVGSIIERKNLLTICKAVNHLKSKLTIPLVVIGGGGKYKKQVKEYISSNGLENQIIFLSENEETKQNEGFKSSAHFPAIYQMAEAMIYPSTFEGFGIPILEALFSKVPVITSNVSCMPEAGGDAALYIDPYDYESLSLKMETIANDKTLAASITEKGWIHAQNFSQQKTAAHVMNVYKKLLP